MTRWKGVLKNIDFCVTFFTVPKENNFILCRSRMSKKNVDKFLEFVFLYAYVSKCVNDIRIKSGYINRITQMNGETEYLMNKNNLPVVKAGVHS